MKLSLMKNLLVFAGFAFLLTSCDPDIIDPPGVSDPTVSVSGVPAGVIAAGSTFTITVTATPTTENALKSVAFKEENTNIDFGRIAVDGSAASSNPILLFGDEKNGLNWTVDIVAHDDASLKQYEFEVTDDGNNVGQFTFDIQTEITLVEPTLSISGEMDIMLDPGTTLAIDASLGKGTHDLASLAFYQGDDLITDLDRVGYIELGNKITANPYLLPESEQDGGEVKLWLKVQEVGGTQSYRIVLTDVEGNSVDYNFNITTGTPIDEVLEGVLLNAGGPAGTGGLDLDTGNGTGSNDAEAEIKDLGIDIDEAAANNWIQKISGANDATIKQLKVGENDLLEGFTFGGVSSKQQIASLYTENGIDLTDGVSDVVLAGDIFVVNRGDNFYLIQITAVNITADNNSDNYVMDIKK